MQETSVVDSAGPSAVAAQVVPVTVGGLFVVPHFFVDRHVHVLHPLFAAGLVTHGEQARLASSTTTDLVYWPGHTILEESAGLVEQA